MPTLLTPGPLTTHAEVQEAMTCDWGSRDPVFVAMSDDVRHRLTAMVGDPSRWAAVLLQGSGTFAVEAALGTLLPRDGHLLVVEHGAYGQRMAQIARVLNRRVTTVSTPEDVPPSLDAIAEALSDPSITHVAACVCETTTGMAAPVGAIARLVAEHGRKLILDAMSAFGAVHLRGDDLPFHAVIASSNKCLEGAPGIGFCVVRRDELAASAGNAPSLCLDLHAQQARFDVDGQWRFTPPTHVLAALHRALVLHTAEGGVDGRGARYQQNLRVLVDGMREIGFQTLLPDAIQAPIIVTFLEPTHPSWSFQAFYDALLREGFAIYPGKLTVQPSFRVGCIGQVFPNDLRDFVTAVRRVADAQGLRFGA